MIGFTPSWRLAQGSANNPIMSPMMPMPIGLSGLGDASDTSSIAPDAAAEPSTAMVSAPVSSALPATVQPSAALSSEIDGFLLNTPNPNSHDVVSFLKFYRGQDRLCAAQALVARGLNAHMVMAALRHLGFTGMLPGAIFGFFSLLVASATAYHGVRRNHGSVLSGVVWFAAGSLFPVLASIVAIGQGYAKPRPIG